MPTSQDPEARQRQLANLRPDAAARHGAYSEPRLEPLRERFIGELTDRFGTVATAVELQIAADRMARTEAISRWLDKRGMLADRRSGKPREVVKLLERLQTALERQLAEWRRRRGATEKTGPMHERVLRIELTAAERVGMLSTDADVRIHTTHEILTRLREEHEQGHTSLYVTTARDEWDGKPPERLNPRDMSDEHLAWLEELTAQAEAEAEAADELLQRRPR